MKRVLNGKLQKKVSRPPKSPIISEKLSRLIIENSYDVVALIDKEGQYLYISSSIKNILGYDYKELIGRNGLDFIHPDEFEYARGLLGKLAKNPNTRVLAEVRMKHKNNSWRWIEASGTNLLHDPSIQAIVCNFHDISLRKVYENNLAKSEQMLRLLINSAPFLIAYVDNKMRYRFNNIRYAEWFNLTNTQIHGKYVKEVIGVKAFNVIKPSIEKVLSGQHVTFESYIPFKTATKYVIANFVPHFGNNTEVLGYYVVEQDLTEHKLAEQKIQDSEERYRRLVETTGIIPWESSYETGEYTYVGPQAVKILGYPVSKWYKKKFWNSIIHSEDRSRTVDYYLKTSRIKKNYEFEYRMINSKGEILWFRDIVSVISENNGRKILTGFLINITADKRAEKALEASESKFRNMADAATVMIWVTDITGNCVYMNKRWTEFTGQPIGEALGNGWLNTIHPDDHSEAKDKFLVAFKKREPFRVMYRVKSKEGHFRWFMDNSAPTFDTKGNINGFIGTVADINDRIELERKKDEFMSVASHELKTPVTSLKAYTQLLQKEFTRSATNPTAINYLDKMDQQISKLTNLILDLLDVSKIEAGKLQFRKKKTAIMPLVRDTIDSIQATAEDHVIVMQGRTSASISADADRISQIIVNLLNNAIKYSPLGSRIFVQVAREKNHVIISVRDLGIGMTKEQQKHIFERFYQAESQVKKQQPGLGIGLYISHEIAIRHGGSLHVESKVGKGSTFILTLPVYGTSA